MKPRLFHTIGAVALAAMLYLGTAGDDGLVLLPEAHAIVGAPLTPVSVAGVARRTTRRVVAVEATAAAAATTTAQQQQAVAQQQAATAQQQAAVAQQQAAVAQQQAGAPAVGSIVTTLPPGCTQSTKNGVAYQECGGVFYRAAFQGNNLVYVVTQP
jgi:nucleoid-associated protein YgaU